MFTVGIIIASDKGSKGERLDQSGMVIKEFMTNKGYQVEKYCILPDQQDLLEKEMIYMSDELHIDLILTSGGTGFSKRDVTPEATLAIIDRQAQGIAEAIRYNSLQITPRGMLSRGISGMRKDTLIINLPGSPKAVQESLEYILSSVKHGLEILKGIDAECGRK